MSIKRIVGAVVLGFALAGVAQVEPAIRPRWSGAAVGEWTMDSAAAFEAAATNTNSRGVVMYFVGFWWCPYCKAVENFVLTQDGWQDYVASNQLYLVAIDNPGRTGNNSCWLWNSDYVLNDTPMTLPEAEQEVLDRYALQTQYATPGSTYNEAFDYYQIGYPTMVIFRPGDSVSPMGRTSFPDLRTGYSPEAATALVLRQIEQILQADDEDEADNYAQGATALDVSEACEDNLVDYGSRTLSERDTADWYSFASSRNRQWTFEFTPGARGATNTIAAALYSDPTKSSVLSKTFLPSGAAGLTYITPKDGTYYLRVSRPSGSQNVLQGYHLAYGYTIAPANVTFARTAVSVADTSTGVSLQVNISNAELADLVEVNFETEDITAVAGTDYVAATGVLSWAEGEKKASKAITVTTLPPAAWVGDRTFQVTLTAVRNCAVTELSTCVVTLKAPARKAGKLAFATGTPKAITLAEGEDAAFNVTRAGGADGAVAAQVDLVQGGAAAAVTNLVWASGDDAPKTVNFGFPVEPGYQPDQTFTLRLTALDGASLGSPSSVSVTRRDSLVAQTFEAFAASNKTWSLKVAGGAWFYGFLTEGGPEEWLRSAPLTGGGETMLSMTLTGPGALMFTPWRGGGAEMSLLVNGGAVTNDFDDGAAHWVALPSGKQTVTWQVGGPAGAFGAVGALAFVQLPQAAPLSPPDKSVVAADPRDGFFAWAGVTLPLPLEPLYVIAAGAKASAMTPGGGASAETVFPRAGVTAEMDWLTGLLVPGGVSWRVDTVIEDAYGRQAVRQGGVSSVTVIDAAAPAFDTGALPPDCVMDATDGATVGAPPFTVGVRAMVGPFQLVNAGGGAAGVAVRNGKLPGGIGVQAIDGALWLTGVPKAADAGKAGGADLVLSVKQSVGGKTVTVQGTSLRVAWEVAPLGRVAGSYNGFAVTATDEPGYGNGTMTVSASGKVSGKFRHGGAQYTFSAPNFDRIDGGQFVVTNAVAKAGKTLLSVSLGVDPAQAPEAALTVNGGGDGSFLLYRNNWKDAAPMGGSDALANYLGYYTAALPVETSGGAAAPAGTGYLTLTVNAKGTVKIAGALADGKRASASAVLLYGPDCCSSTDRLMFYLLAIPSGYGAASGLYGIIQFVPDTSNSPADVTLVPVPCYMTWVNTNPKSVYGYDVTTGVSSEGALGFTNILNVVGGYYDKKTSLVNYYGAGTALAFEPLFGAPTDLDGAQGASGFALLSLPVHTNLPMTVTAAAKLTAPAQALVKDGGLVDCEASANPWGMAFSFKPATGLFTASFKAYYQNGAQQKTKAFTAKGVFVPRREAYDTPVDWYGFYLVPDSFRYLGANGKPARYPFAWSYDVRLGEAAP